MKTNNLMYFFLSYYKTDPYSSQNIWGGKLNKIKKINSAYNVITQE